MHGRAISFLCGVSFVAFGAFAVADPADTLIGICTFVNCVNISGPLFAAIPSDIITPGAIASHDSNEVCGIINGLTYSKRHRATPYDLKAAIRQRDHSTGGGEVDHRVPLCLGGADVEANLWWQQNFKHKDELEAWACRAVCHEHTLGLDAAQTMFLGDWRESYKQVFGVMP